MSVIARNNVNIVGREDGPTIMLVHGFGCDQNLWRLVVDRLKAGFRLVLIDLVGSGSSDPEAWDAEKYSSLSGYAADILEIVDELDLRDVVFVGHSVSAMIGALAAIANPSRFAKLVLLTPSPCYIDDAEYRGGFSKADIDELLESLEQNYLGWSKAMAPVIMGTPDRPELQDELAETFCRADPEHARVFARATFLSDNRADLAQVPLPTLVIECTQDAIAPREVGAYVHAHIRQSAGNAGCRRPLSARQCPGRNRCGHRGVRSADVTSGVEDFWEHAPCGHVIAHPDGRIIRANATLARWLGYEPDALCGMPFSRSVDGRRTNSLRHPFRAVAADGRRSQRCDRRCRGCRRSPAADVSHRERQESGLTRSRNGCRSPSWMPLTAAPTRGSSWQARQQAEEEQGRVRVFAETLRRALLPPVLSPPDGLEAADYYFTASDDDVGGDFYDLFPLSRTTWGFFLGDVAGKGVDAAVVTALTGTRCAPPRFSTRIRCRCWTTSTRVAPTKSRARAFVIVQHLDLREDDEARQRI